MIAGKYRVRAILGRSHGLLVDAFHTEFDQRVAIKVLFSGIADEKAVSRFRREARTLAKLESEHVARIIDVGRQDGSFYLVRQFLDGVDLATSMRQPGALPIDEAVLYVLQIAEALAETHSHGIILRELQPSHVFVTRRAGGGPLLKITDFGTAKLMRDAAAPGEGSLTASTMFGLSPYSSPELVRKAKDVDVRTDVWSLGAILYELLTGRAPFVGEAASLMLQIARDPLVPARTFRPELPPVLDDILGWSMAKDVDARFRNVHAFAHALLPFASPEGQVLIERIGQITQSGKQRKAALSLVPAAPPPRAGLARVALPMPTPPRREELTELLPLPPLPSRGVARGPLPMPSLPPRAAHPAWSAPPARTRELLTPPPRTSSSYPPPAAPPAPASSPQAPMAWAPVADVAPAAPPSAGTTWRHRTLPGFDRRLALGALVLAMIALPVMVFLLVLRRSAPTSSSAPIVIDTAAMIAAMPTAAPVAPAPSPAPAPVAAPAPAAVEAPSAATDSGAISLASLPSTEDAPAAKSSASRAAPRGRPAPKAAPAPPPPPPVAAAEAPASTENGTLAAVVVGGTCAFSVNGAAKGTTSTLRLSLKPGTYSVTCRPSGGATKSKSIAVKPGVTSMAMFRL